MPDEPFAAGEQVTVTTGLAVRGATNGTYTFAIGVPATFPDAPLPTPQAAPNQKPVDDLEHFVSRPDLTAPKMTVTANSAGASPGDVFVTPVGGDAQPALVILDQEGQPLWISPTSGAVASTSRCSCTRASLCSRGNRGLRGKSRRRAGWLRDRRRLVPADRVRPCGERLLRPHPRLHHHTPGHRRVHSSITLLSSTPTSVKGAKKQEVLEAVVQEIDIASGELRFEWHSLATVPLGDSYLPVPKTATDMYDYVHPNSITVDLDGNLLLSGRHTWTVYKIDRSSRRAACGDSAGSKTTSQWRGTPSPCGSTTPVATPIRASRSSTTVRAARQNTRTSRGLVLDLDEGAMTASLRRAYLPPTKPKIAASESQGAFRLLANGDYFAGWGSQPEYTEYAPDGTVLYNVRFPGKSPPTTISSYRAVKSPWTGHPTDVPAIAVTRQLGATTVYASWNGATEVASWQVLAGPDLAHLVPVTTVPKHGFETTIHVTRNDSYFAVQALDACRAPCSRRQVQQHRDRACAPPARAARGQSPTAHLVHPVGHLA